MLAFRHPLPTVDKEPKKVRQSLTTSTILRQ